MATVVLLPLAPWARDSAGFAGGAFGAPNDRARWQAVGSCDPARRAGGAVPGVEMAPCSRAAGGRSQDDRGSDHGRTRGRSERGRACYRWSSTRPWCFTPSPTTPQIHFYLIGPGLSRDKCRHSGRGSASPGPAKLVAAAGREGWRAAELRSWVAAAGREAWGPAELRSWVGAGRREAWGPAATSQISKVQPERADLRICR